MEFLLIGESKLKIVMNEDDIREYKIEIAMPDCTAPMCRRAIWSILDKAKSEVGFDPTGDKVLVQFYPVKKTECEVFITKLGILSLGSAKIISRSERIAMLSRERKIYSFDTLEALIHASKTVKRSFGFSPVSDCYKGVGEQYFLSVEEYGKGGETFEFPQILEFGKNLSADFRSYLSEHTELIFNGDAIERISAYST